MCLFMVSVQYMMLSLNIYCIYTQFAPLLINKDMYIGKAHFSGWLFVCDISCLSGIRHRHVFFFFFYKCVYVCLANHK